MAKVLFAFPACPFIFALLASCSLYVDGQLEKFPDSHCREMNVRIEKELATDTCMIVPGEVLTVRMKHFQPETDARISFSPADSVSSILLVMDVPVTPEGSFPIQMPELSVPVGTRVRVQIQGVHAGNAFSGSLEVIVAGLAAALKESGHLDLFLAGEEGFRRAASLDAPVAHRMVFSPCGRFLATGSCHIQDEKDGVLPDGGKLTILSPFRRWPILEEDATGGISSMVFLPMNQPDRVQLLSSLQDFPDGLWRVVAKNVTSLEAQNHETVQDLPKTTFPPRMVYAGQGAVWMSTDPLGAWHNNTPAPPPEAFAWIDVDKSVRLFPCETLFNGGETWHPFSVVAGDPQTNDETRSWWSCARKLPENPPRYEIRGAWFLTSPTGPQPESIQQETTIVSANIPHEWHFSHPVGTKSTGLLNSRCTVPDCHVHVLPADQPAFSLSVGLLEPQITVPEVLLQKDLLIVYVPVALSGSPLIVPPNTLFGERIDGEWIFSAFGRDVRHAVFATEELLLLAKSTQLVQSTIPDFRTGYQGDLISPQVYKRISLSTGYRKTP